MLTPTVVRRRRAAVCAAAGAAFAMGVSFGASAGEDHPTTAATPAATAQAPGAPPLPKVPLRVQVSADGMRWIDEGAACDLPQNVDRDSFVRVRHFGNWLRLAAVLPEGLAIKALVTIHLK